MNYTDFIRRTQFVKDDELEVVLTTGDVDYSGTALEVTCDNIELFHFVVDEDGVQQVVVFPQKSCYRMNLSTLDAIILAAKEEVRSTNDSK